MITNQNKELVSVDVPDRESYGNVFVGYPIRWREASWVVDDFANENDFTGKTIIPCSTHASSGLTGSPRTIRELEPDATVIDDGFTVAASKVTSAEDNVTAWADKHELN